MDAEAEELWVGRVEKLLDEALVRLREGGGDEVLMAISAADAAMRVVMGDLEPEEMECYPFPGEPVPENCLPACICPPELVARGGFKGGCPRHSLVRTTRGR